MLYHDTGKLQIFANDRCANTNMYYYFNPNIINNDTLPGKVIILSQIFSDDLVIVLRNPLDRVVSSIKGVPKILSLMDTLGTFLTSIYGKDFNFEEYATFKMHCSPYLYRVKDRPFRIIDFNKLDGYIPRKENAFQSPVTNSSGYTDPKSVYVENKYFTLNDLEIEYETYLELLKDREQISVTEWKEKTT